MTNDDSDAEVEEEGLNIISKNQLAKASWKLKKKQEKLTSRLIAIGENIASASALRNKLQLCQSTKVEEAAMYQHLDRQTTAELYSPNADHSLSIISTFVDRASKYNEKNSSQELSIAFQVFKLIYPKRNTEDALDVIVDVGAGNANLSCLLAMIFDVPIICVEKDSNLIPELQGERRLPSPQFSVKRVEILIEEYVLPSEFNNAVVLGKHLCGVGTDAGIRFLESTKDKVLGTIWCTCCCNKITEEYGSSLFEELNGVDDHETLVTVAKTTAWRTVQVEGENDMKSSMDAEAGFAESWIQGFRRRKLARIFGWCDEVIYCSGDVHSQQNRCIVSGRHKPGDDSIDLRAAFFALLDKQVCKLTADNVIPLDLVARDCQNKRASYEAAK